MAFIGSGVKKRSPVVTPGLFDDMTPQFHFDPTATSLITVSTGSSNKVIEMYDRINGTKISQSIDSRRPHLAFSDTLKHNALFYSSASVQFLAADNIEESIGQFFEGSGPEYECWIEFLDTSVGLGATKTLFHLQSTGADSVRLYENSIGGIVHEREPTTLNSTTGAGIKDKIASWMYLSSDATNVQNRHSLGAVKTTAHVADNPQNLVRFGLGARNAATSPLQTFEGQIGHVVGWNRKLTDAERAEVIDRLERQRNKPVPENILDTMPTQLSLKPFGWWRADEGVSGSTWVDRTVGHVGDGTGHAPAFVSSTGSLGNQPCFSFDGNTQYFVLSSSFVSQFSASNYTAAVIYTRAASGNNRTLWCASRNDTTQNYFDSFVTNTTSIQTLVHNQNGATSTFAGTKGQADGAHYIIQSYDGSNVTGRLDGAIDDTDAMTQSPALVPNQGAIGVLKRTGLGSRWNSNIAELIFYPGVLDANDIKLLEEYIERRYTLNPWDTIEALSPFVVLDPNRGVDLGTGTDVTRWTDQANGYIWDALGGFEPSFFVTGSSPSKAPTITNPSGSNSILHNLLTSSLYAPFEADGTFEVYVAMRRLTSTSTQTVWQLSNTSSADAVGGLLANASVQQTFQQFGTGFGTQAINADNLNVDHWNSYRAISGSGYTFEVRGHGTDTDPITTRESPFHNFELFNRHTTGTHGSYADIDMYGFIVFDRELTPNERAIVTSSLDRLMGL